MRKVVFGLSLRRAVFNPRRAQMRSVLSRMVLERVYSYYFTSPPPPVTIILPILPSHSSAIDVT